MPAPWGRSFHRIGVHATLQDAGAEPLANKPQDSRVGNPVRQHPQQPVVVNAVEVSADVGSEYDTLSRRKRMDNYLSRKARFI
jgi:hypothetical protein